MITGGEDALEKAFYMFSNCQKIAEYYAKDDIYRLCITFYEFDEREVIAKLLSLGSYVKVVKPDNLREKIVERIRKAIARY